MVNEEPENVDQTIENDTTCDENQMSYDWSDPDNWPQILSKELQYEIIKLGPTRVESYDFPTTSKENGQKRKFTTKLSSKLS